MRPSLLKRQRKRRRRRDESAGRRRVQRSFKSIERRLVGREASLKTQMVGVIGLGRMGRGVVNRLVAAGFGVVAYDRDPAAAAQLPPEAKTVTGVREVADAAEWAAHRFHARARGRTGGADTVWRRRHRQRARTG